MVGGQLDRGHPPTLSQSRSEAVDLAAGCYLCQFLRKGMSPRH